MCFSSPTIDTWKPNQICGAGASRTPERFALEIFLTGGKNKVEDLLCFKFEMSIIVTLTHQIFHHDFCPKITFEFRVCRGRKVHTHTHTYTHWHTLTHSHLRLACHVSHVLSATEQFCWSSRRFSALLNGISVVVVDVVIVGQKCAFHSPSCLKFSFFFVFIFQPVQGL